MISPSQTHARNLWIIALLLVVAGTVLVLVVSTQNDRANVLHASREELLFNATLSAMRLDSIFQAAARELGGFAASRGPDEALHDVAFGIPQAANIYVFDELGNVISAAYYRNQQRVKFDPILLQRLQAGALTEYRVIDAPGEGGSTLAVVRRLDGDSAGNHFVAAFFSAQSIQGSLILLTTKSYSTARLIDVDGKFVNLGEQSAMRVADGIEVALADTPLKVRFEADPVVVLAPWRRRTAAIVSMVVVLALVIATLLTYSILQWKRALEADDMRRELDHQETLYREVNHRIKNNLAIVQTILDFGTDRIREYPGSAIQTLDSAIDRVRAITSLHELLYKVPPSEHDDFGLYAQSLAQAVKNAYGYHERIDVQTRSDENLRLALDQMVPLALILNELLTNAFKYAFPDGRSGSIMIDAKRGNDGSLVLEVRDDGIGLTGYQASSGGIGMFLVETLASQLKATVETSVMQPTGVVCKVVVPPFHGKEAYQRV